MRKRSERKAQTHIHQHQRRARSKKELDEPAGVLRLSSPVEIEHPNNRKVLDVVPRFEQRQTHQGTLHHTGRIAQVNESHANENELEWIWRMSLPDGRDYADYINCSGRYRDSKPSPSEPHESFCRNARSTAPIEIRDVRRQVHVQHEHAHAEPHQTYCSVQPCGSSCFGSGFSIIDAGEAIHLHHPVPLAPQQREQKDNVQIEVSECSCHCEQKQRRKNQANSKPAEKSSIAIGPQDAGQVMRSCQRQSECKKSIHPSTASRGRKCAEYQNGSEQNEGHVLNRAENPIMRSDTLTRLDLRFDRGHCVA